MKIRLIIISLCVLTAGIGYGIYVLSERDNHRWEQFKKDHKCRLISRTEPIVGFGTNGQTIVTPGQNGWLCDDGVIYYR